MKNKFIISLILMLSAVNTVSASSWDAFQGMDLTGMASSQDKGPKVISDSEENQKAMKDLEKIHNMNGGFFVSRVKKDEGASNSDSVVQEQGFSIGSDSQTHGTIAPVKRLRLKLKAAKNVTKADSTELVEPVSKNQALLDCDEMQYYADKTELEGVGHVVVFFPKNNATIKADRMTYNQTSNFIKAYGNVVMIKDGKELYGDYMQIDMNEENAFMDDPKTDLFQIRSHAKKGYLYGDKLVQENGDLLITKKTMMKLKNDMFGPDLDNMFIKPKDKSCYKKDSHGEGFKIVTDDLIINAKKEHDVLTLKHASIYVNEKKICTIPSITIHTNKAQDYVEANYPEFGTMMNMGAYIGPGFDFDTPHGTNLKVIPILNYQSNGDNSGDNSFGWGGIAKFKSATNKTDIAYGTANKMVITRGKQRLDDHLFFQYGSNAFMDNWFLGYRMPKLMGELVFENEYPQKDFLGKDKPMTFKQRIGAGYMQDNDADGYTNLLNSSGGVGTSRFQYMGEVIQTWYTYSSTKLPLLASFSTIAEGAAAVYGTGDTQMIGRVGPMLHTQVKYWMQDVGYFLSTYNDNTPLVRYDKYMYGRSNAYARESLRLCKYLTLSWFVSLNLSQDSWDGNMLQENSLFVSLGPDDVRLNVGYDSVRQQSFVSMAFALDAKGSKVEYKKMVIKNPERVGKSQNEENEVKPVMNNQQNEASTQERAEVIDINNSTEGQ